MVKRNRYEKKHELNVYGIVRAHAAVTNLVLMIEAAIDECIEKGYLADILEEERAEVFDMFLDGCSVEEYTRLQVRDQVAIATKEVTQQVTQQALKALVNNLKPFVPDIDAVTETIKKNEGFENITREMVEKYW